MKIITIGTDEKVLDQNSRAHLRVKEYANLADSYTVFVFTSDPQKAKVTQGNFSVIPVFGKNKLIQVWRLFKLMREIQETNIVISSQDPFEVGLISYFISRTKQWKFHLQIHTEFFSSFFKNESFRRRLQFYFARYLTKKAYGIRVVSKRIQKYLKEIDGIPDNRIVCAPIFVELVNVEIAQKDPNLVISVSRLEKEKNFNRLIGAFEILAANNPSLRLDIYGEGSERINIEKLIVRSVFKERIRLKGAVSNPFKAMAEAKVFVISSDYEGWGMTAVESVMSGTPVAMTPVGCAGEFIMDGVNGFVSKDFGKEEFAKTLLKALNYNFNDIKQTLKTLQTKEEYMQKIKQSWQNL